MRGISRKLPPSMRKALVYLARPNLHTGSGKLSASPYRVCSEIHVPCQLFHEQPCYLHEVPVCPVKPGTAAHPWKQVVVVAFHKRIPCFFGINPKQFTTYGNCNTFCITEFCFFILRLFFTDTGTYCWYKSSIKTKTSRIKSSKRMYKCVIIITRLQHNIASFFVEVLLFFI